jgi:hypothetical protein
MAILYVIVGHVIICRMNVGDTILNYSVCANFVAGGHGPPARVKSQGEGTPLLDQEKGAEKTPAPAYATAYSARVDGAGEVSRHVAGFTHGSGQALSHIGH